MKKLILPIAIIAGLILTSTATADGWRHSGYRDGWGASWDRHLDYGDYRGRRFFRPYGNRGYHSSRSYRGYRPNPYHFPSYERHRRGGDYFSFSFNSYPQRHRYRHHDDDSFGSFIGGVVLGSIFSQPARTVHHETVRYVRSAPVVHRQKVYVQPRVVRETGRAGRDSVSLLRDLQGNCFERHRDSDGREIRIKVDERECDF